MSPFLKAAMERADREREQRLFAARFDELADRGDGLRGQSAAERRRAEVERIVARAESVERLQRMGVEAAEIRVRLELTERQVRHALVMAAKYRRRT